jgi:hypothetical protein
VVTKGPKPNGDPTVSGIAAVSVDSLTCTVAPWLSRGSRQLVNRVEETTATSEANECSFDLHSPTRGHVRKSPIPEKEEWELRRPVINDHLDEVDRPDRPLNR